MEDLGVKIGGFSMKMEDLGLKRRILDGNAGL